jgi:cobalt/nickel transport protein
MSAKSKRFYLYFFLASVAIAGIFSFYASSSPDGLEKVAQDQGFLSDAKDSVVTNSPLADYGVSGIDHDRISVGVSGLIGIAVTAAIAFGCFTLLRILKARSKR